MRWSDIIADVLHPVTETKPSGGVGPTPPLTPAKMRTRKAKQDKALTHVQDVQAANALRLKVAQRKTTETQPR